MEDKIQVRDRLPAFDPGGTLAADAAELWGVLEPHVTEMARTFWDNYRAWIDPAGTWSSERRVQALASGVDYMRRFHSAPTSSGWVEQADRLVTYSRRAGVPAWMVHGAMTASRGYCLELVTQALRDDPDRLGRMAATLLRLYALEAEVMSALAIRHRESEARDERSRQAEMFNDRIGSEVEAASHEGERLRAMATDAALSVRGMLGKASEVASATEQSAMAMREAAQTAAGLIRAIEDARGEVEIAADVGGRAAQQSAQAVEVSEALSDHARAIESILGLIRDIAGQTNLLALNATIEAARAGDAGRGFAVVAQEVKSLASQTARATDDIAAKIAAIQAATRQTVDANGSIRDTVGEIHAFARRLRDAMEMQARTVTNITASVDETALAAASAADTVALIRGDTGAVAERIDHLEKGLHGIDGRLGELRQSAGEFVARISG